TGPCAHRAYHAYPQPGAAPADALARRPLMRVMGCNCRCPGHRHLADGPPAGVRSGTRRPPGTVRAGVPNDRFVVDTSVWLDAAELWMRAVQTVLASWRRSATGTATRPGRPGCG